MGLHRFRFIVTTINIIIFIIIFPIVLVTIYFSPDFATPTAANSNFSNFLTHSYWIETAIGSLHRELPGDIIALSAVSNPSISSTVDTVIIYSAKICFLMMLTMWVSICATLIQRFYNVQDSFCVQVEGDIFIFAMVPDMLQRLPLAQFWLILYFLIIIYWGVSATIYVYDAFFEALLEEYPILGKWRFILSAGICMAIGTLNVMLLQPDFISIFRDIADTSTSQIKAFILICSLAGIFVYTIGKVRTDYHFYKGVILANSWIQGAKIAMFLVFVTAIMYLVKRWPHNGYKFWCCIAAAPVPIAMIVVIIEYITKMRRTLMDSDPNWGPPTKKMKMDRIRFDTTYSLRHKAQVSDCRHNCLITSPDLNKEIKYWNSRKKDLADIYERNVSSENDS